MSSLTAEQLAKLDLRENVLLQRHKVNAADAHKAMLQISEDVNDLIGEKRRIQNVALYAPINKELEMMFLTEMLSMRGISICLPRVIRKNEAMIFNTWDMLTLHDKDVEGIPCAKGEEVQPDIVILPVVAFNRQGYRLGYGSGYYDRTFSQSPKDIFKIGVGYAFQESDQFKGEKHDIPLDVMVTEKEILHF
jgi:5-formyltetrahydrofolate cyclo-ligase